jgi:hypothetical protein
MHRQSVSEPSFPAIANIKAAGTLALDDDLAVPRAQFDLPNVSAGAINLLGNKSRAGWTSTSFASRNVAAAVDPNSRCFGIKVRFKHMYHPGGVRRAQLLSKIVGFEPLRESRWHALATCPRMVKRKRACFQPILDSLLFLISCAAIDAREAI